MNLLGISPSPVVFIDQSDASLQRLLGYPWVKPRLVNPGVTQVAKMQKKYTKIYP